MWIIMNDAFLSVVKNRNKKDSLLVRARVEGDIEKVFPKARVRVNQGTDYKYRAFIPKWIVSKAIKKSIENIDYENFKSSVPFEDKLRHDTYLDVWTNLMSLQYGKYKNSRYNVFNNMKKKNTKSDSIIDKVSVY